MLNFVCLAQKSKKRKGKVSASKAAGSSDLAAEKSAKVSNLNIWNVEIVMKVVLIRLDNGSKWVRNNVSEYQM